MTIVEDHTEKPAGKHRNVKLKAQSVAVHQPQPPQAVNTMTVVERAIEKGLTGDDLKQMMDLQERYEANVARKAFDVAMADAQADMPLIVKNRLVNYASTKSPTGFVTYKHEDLGEVIDTIKPILHKHGLAHRFRTNQQGDQVQVTCIITGHGHREETTLASTRDTSGGKNNLQEIASTVTYLERYTLKAALGLAASHDDDGRGSDGEPSHHHHGAAAQGTRGAGEGSRRRRHQGVQGVENRIAGRNAGISVPASQGKTRSNASAAMTIHRVEQGSAEWRALRLGQSDGFSRL